MLRLQDAAVAIVGTMRLEYVAGRHALQRTSDDGAAGGVEHGCSNRGSRRRSHGVPGVV